MRTNECSLWAFMLTVGAGLALSTQALAQSDPLPSWNDGAAKSAINEFVRTTTDQASPKFVPLAERIATFDQDGTLWVEHPVYTQVAYCLDRVPAVVKEKPELAQVEPFKTVLSGNREAMAKLSMDDFLKILAATKNRHECRRVRNRGEELARHCQRRALEAALHRAHLPDNDRTIEVPARQCLQDLYRDRRRSGFRPGVLRASIRHPTRASSWNRRRDQLRL